MNETTAPRDASARGGLPLVDTQTPSLTESPLSKIKDELAKPDAPTGFLPIAEWYLTAAVDEYAAKLGVSAVKNARKRRATAVDRVDVELAAQSQRRTHLQAWLLGLAGLVGGGAIASGVTVALLPEPPPHSRVWWSVIVLLSVLTLLLLAATFPRKAKQA